MIQFGRAVQVLCDGGVESAVVGGLAGSIHGSAPITLDLELCYARNGTNLRRLATVLTFEDLKIGTVEVEAFERRFLTIDLRSLN